MTLRHWTFCTILGTLTLPLNAATTNNKKPKTPTGDAAFEWLEDVEGDKAINWVKKQNAQSMGSIEKSAAFRKIVGDAEKILNAKDKLAFARIRTFGVVNFWQDEQHVRGILRKASLEDYLKGDEKWETIVDFDQLAKDEGENWVFKGSSCLEPKEVRCLLFLSRGGKDATVVREFDYETKKFIGEGFNLPEAKTHIDWLDENSVIVGTDYGPGSMTKSGYPRILKLWKRGQPLAEAATILEGEESDVSVSSFNFYRDGKNYTMLARRIDFFDGEYWYLKDGKEKLKLAMPKEASPAEFTKGHLLVELRKPWGKLPQGALAGVNLEEAITKKSPDDVKPSLIFHPGERGSISSVDLAQDFLVITYLDNIKGKALRFTPHEGEEPRDWEKRSIDLPPSGTLGMLSTHTSTNTAFFTYEDYITPDSIYAVDLKTMKSSLNRQDQPRFDASGLVINQYEGTSKDGTKVPYFIVHRKDLKLDGANPTILYGYGGFQVPEQPQYMGVNGKLWLEKGAVWVSANIRGGGEFGPAWHQAALKENRQKSFDDFIAVAEDLIARKITSSKKLAIMGGSNGGLLVGATFVQRPDLFRSVVCQVPLLDMLRYHKLLAGSSWMAEYGDPEDPKMKPILEAYSPFQNVKPKVKYPNVLFVTSTKDDRVHPGHARKMAAKMIAQGHRVKYFENIEGGHSASANLMQLAKRKGLEFSWLYQELGVK